MEESILAGLLAVNEEPKLIAKTLGLTEDDFFFSANKMVFRAIVSFWNTDTNPDHILVTAEARSRGWLDICGGEGRIESLAMFPQSEVTEEKLRSYIIELRFNRSFRRKINATLLKYASMIYDMDIEATRVVEFLSREISEIKEEFRREDDEHRLQRMSAIMKDVSEEIFAVKQGEKCRPVSSGWPEFDRILASGGLPSELIIVVARPGMGKTSVGVSLSVNIASQGEIVAYFSCEESKSELISRMAINISDGKFDRHMMDNGLMGDSEWEEFWSIYNSGLPIYVTDAPASSWSIEWIEEQLHSIKKETGKYPRILFLDYLNLWVTLQGGGRDESSNRRFYDKILAELQNMTKQYGIAIVAMCQSNRASESRSDKRPQLSDARETGTIEQTGRLILAPYRPDYHEKDASTKPGIVELHILKQNKGQSNIFVELDFVPHKCQINSRY